MKINIDVVKCRKRNARARLMGFQISENFAKMRIPRKIDISNFKKRKLRRLRDGEALYESSVRKLG